MAAVLNRAAAAHWVAGGCTALRPVGCWRYKLPDEPLPKVRAACPRHHHRHRRVLLLPPALIPAAAARKVAKMAAISHTCGDRRLASHLLAGLELLLPQLVPAVPTADLLDAFTPDRAGPAEETLFDHNGSRVGVPSLLPPPLISLPQQVCRARLCTLLSLRILPCVEAAACRTHCLAGTTLHPWTRCRCRWASARRTPRRPRRLRQQSAPWRRGRRCERCGRMQPCGWARCVQRHACLQAALLKLCAARSCCRRRAMTAAGLWSPCWQRCTGVWAASAARLCGCWSRRTSAGCDHAAARHAAR